MFKIMVYIASCFSVISSIRVCYKFTINKSLISIENARDIIIESVGPLSQQIIFCITVGVWVMMCFIGLWILITDNILGLSLDLFNVVLPGLSIIILLKLVVEISDLIVLVLFSHEKVTNNIHKIDESPFI